MGNRYNHPIERIEKNIEIITESGCWIWKGSIDKKGYGCMNAFGKKQFVHRVSYSYYIGEIPKGMLVCHSCDIPTCVNPNHLFIGDYAANNRDCRNKGRANSENARLTYQNKCRENPKKYCINGHEYTFENSYLDKNGTRYCRKCNNSYSLEKQRRRRDRLSSLGLPRH